MKIFPNILIVCNEDVFSSTTSGGLTIKSYFSNWPKDHIYQVVCTSSIQIVSQNNTNLFYITEQDKIFGFIRQLQTKKVHKVAIRNINDVVNTVPKRSIKSVIRSYLIDLYSYLPYKKSIVGFDNFIDKSKIDIIYTASSVPSNILLMKAISKKNNIPYLIHFFDDWPNIVFQNNTLVRHLFTKKLYRMVQESPYCLCISQFMCDTFSNRYHKENFLPLMNTVKSHDCATYIEPTYKQMKVIYAGSLYLGRYQTLKEICKVIETNHLNVHITIYTSETSWLEIKNQFKPFSFLTYGGFLTHEEWMSEIYKVDGLLFLESFDNDILKYTELSLSTKIPEYLSSGKPIFAVGNKNQGSIRYLLENDVAYVATSDDDISSAFMDFASCKDFQTKECNSKMLFHKNHELLSQQTKFYNIVNESIKQWKQ